MALLSEPRMKRRVSGQRRAPFPVPLCDCPASVAEWKIFVGELRCNGVHVVDDMKTLHNMGFFGKGTLSKSAPIYHKAKDPEDICIEYDSDGCPIDGGSSATETLQLTFEEAFFLMHGLSTLIVKDEGRELSVLEAWQRFSNMAPDKNFPITYAAYLHFRSKGWVVKRGLKFGADFLLYKDGPSFSHATYAVVLHCVRSGSLREMDHASGSVATWRQLSSINRVNVHAAKEVLFCYVIRPSDLSDEELASPVCLPRFQVQEVLVKRWIASEEREKKPIAT